MRHDLENRNLMLKKIARSLFTPALVFATCALLLTIGVVAQSAQSPQSESPAETAGQRFKNVKVLKDIPASQLIPAMRYITVALGVDCRYCHVKGNFASDDKQTKQTARRMMTMLFAINKNNFNDRPEVSCYTCHQGHHEPMGVPPLAEATAQPQFSRLPAGAPTLTAVLAKFEQAQGGNAALSGINTRVLTLQETRDNHTSTVQIYQQAPNKMYSVTTTKRGKETAGFDGSNAWMVAHRGNQQFTREVIGLEEVILRTEAQINPSAAIAEYKPKRLFGTAKIGDQNAYVVIGDAPDGSMEILFFDQQSGLLLRRMIRYRTVLGALPVEADYSDYREVNGVKIPYKISWSTNGETASYTVKKVEDNVPVDASKFEPPANSQ